jgi:hypothetical protein
MQVKNEKKTVLVCLIGLYRTFKETSKNIFMNIIEPNMDRYDFTIVINTDFECNNCNPKYSDPEQRKQKDAVYKDVNELTKDLTEVYNKHNQLSRVDYCNYNGELRCLFEYRTNIILEQEVKNNYDIIITARLDIIVNKQVDLDKCGDAFYIISGNEYRPYVFHNRDWAMMWIGDSRSFHGWLNSINGLSTEYISKKYSFKKPEADKKLTNEEIIELYKFYNIDAGYCPDKFMVLYKIYINNIKMFFTDKEELFSIGVRAPNYY